MRQLFLLLLFFCFVVTQIDGQSQEQVTDESFLDALIADDPVESETETAAPQQAQAAPVTTPPPAAPIRETGTPVGTGAGVSRQTSNVYSSSPDLYAEDPRVQETPDIPEFSHKSHIEDIGAECVQCHQTLFSDLVRGYKVGPSMKEVCSQCHNGTDAPAELIVGFSDEKKYTKPTMPLFSHTTHIQHTEKCNACHKDIYKPLKEIAKVPPMKLCMRCHDNRKANGNCAVCHEDPEQLKPRSHTARWVYRNGHGNDARYNRRECFDCHTDRECNQCHRGQSDFEVHRPGYKYSHGMDARTRTVNCGYCHDLENSCVQCHARKR